MKKRVPVYIAAPLRADTEEAMAENRANAGRWACWLAERFRIAPECSWIVMTTHLQETSDNRGLGLECDLILVERCDELWMVGGRISTGMGIEADRARECGMTVVDLTEFGAAPRWPDDLAAIEKLLRAAGSRCL